MHAEWPLRFPGENEMGHMYGVKYNFERAMLTGLGFGANLAMRHWPKRRLDMTPYYYDEYYDVVDQHLLNEQDRRRVPGYSYANRILPERHYHLQSFGQCDGVGGTFVAAWSILLAPIIILFPLLLYLAADATKAVVAKHHPKRYDPDTAEEITMTHTEEYKQQLIYARAYHPPVVWEPISCGAMFGAGTNDVPLEQEAEVEEPLEDDGDSDDDGGQGNDEGYGHGEAKVVEHDADEDTDEEGQLNEGQKNKRNICPQPFKRRQGWQKMQYEERQARRKKKRLAKKRKKRAQEGWLTNKMLKLIGMNSYGCDGLHTSFAWDAAGMLSMLEPFHRSAWWWQSLEFTRRLALVMLIAVASSPSPAIPGPSPPTESIMSPSPDKGGTFFTSWTARGQLVTAAMVMLPFLGLTILIRPYNDRRTQLLALLTQCANMMQLGIGIAITDGYIAADAAWLDVPLGLAVLVVAGVAGVLLGVESHIKSLLLMRHNYNQLAAARFLFEHTKLGNLKLLEAWDRMVPVQTPGSTFPKPHVFVGQMDQLTELQGRADHVTVLSARGPAPERHTLLHAAVKHAQPAIVRWLLKIDGDLKMTQGCSTAERLMMARTFWLESLTEGERELELKREKAKKRVRLAREAGMTPEEFDEHFGVPESDSDDDGTEKEVVEKVFEGESGGVSYKSAHFTFEETDSFKSTFDKGGLLFHIGTNGGSRSYMNPHESCEVTARMSSIDDKGSTKDIERLHGSPERFISNTLPGGDGAARTGQFRKGDPWNRTKDEENSWMSVDIGEGRVLIPKWYVIRHGFGDVGIRGEGRLRSWRLEASAENKMNRNIEASEEPDEPDPASWVVLRTHTNDLSLAAGPYSTADFEIKSCPPATEGAPKGVAFRHFRIVQTGPNSSGTHHMMCAGFELYGELRDGDRRAIDKKLRDRRHKKAREKEKEDRLIAEAENKGTGLEWGRSEKAAGHKTVDDLKEEKMSEGEAIELARVNAMKAAVMALHAAMAGAEYKNAADAAATKAYDDAQPTPEQVAAKEAMKMEARVAYIELADIVDGATRTPLDLAIKNLTTQWQRERSKRIERQKRNPRLRAAEESMARPASAGAKRAEGGSQIRGRAPMPTEVIRHGEDDHDRKKRAAYAEVNAADSVVEAFAEYRAGTFVGMTRVKVKGARGVLFGCTELVPTSGLDLENKYPLATNGGVDQKMVTVRALAPCLRTLVLLDLRGAGLGMQGGLLVAKIFGDAADAHQGVRDERRKLGFPVSIRKLDLRRNDIGPTVRKALAIALLRLGGLAVSRNDYGSNDGNKNDPNNPGKNKDNRTVCLSPLQELHLPHWSVGDKDNKATVLNLEYKKLSKDDVLLIAAVLQTTSSLTSINLSHNSIGYGDQHDCGQALGMLLQVLDFNHPSLHTLNLRRNFIKAEMLQVQLSAQLVLGDVGGMASTNANTKLGRTALKVREKKQLPPSYFLVFEHSGAQEKLQERDQQEIDNRKVEVTLCDLLLCPYRKLIHAAVGCMPVQPTHHRADGTTAEDDAEETPFSDLAVSSTPAKEANTEMPEEIPTKKSGDKTAKALTKSAKETAGKTVGRRFKRRHSFVMEVDPDDEERTGTVDGGSVVGLGLSLTSLDLSENSLQGDALRPIAQWLKHNNTMTSLDLSSNDFGTAFEGAEGENVSDNYRDILDKGRSPSPELARQEFQAARIAIGSRPPSPTAVGAGEQLKFKLNCRNGVKELLGAVATSHALLSLGMASTGLGGWKDKQLVQLLGSSMGKFHTLCELKLPSCGLSSNDLKVMATAILWYGVSSISHLDLSNNVTMGVIISQKKGGSSDGTYKTVKADGEESEDNDVEIEKLTEAELAQEIEHSKSGLEVFAMALNNLPRLHKLELRGCCLCGLISEDDHQTRRSALGKRKGGSRLGKVAGTYTLDGLEALSKAFALNASKAGTHDKEHGGVLVHGLQHLELSDNILCSGGIEVLVNEWILPTCLEQGKKLNTMPEQVAAMAAATLTQFFDPSMSGGAKATPEAKSKRRRSMRLGSGAALNEGAVTATMGPPATLVYLGLRRTAACTAYKYAHEAEVRMAATTVKEKLKRNVGMLATMRRMSGAFGFGAVKGKSGGGMNTEGLLAAVKEAAEVREKARMAKEAAQEEAAKEAAAHALNSNKSSMKLKMMRAAGASGAQSALASAFALGAAEAKRRKEEVERLKRKKHREQLSNFFFTKYDPDPLEHICKAVRAGLRNSQKQQADTNKQADKKTKGPPPIANTFTLDFSDNDLRERGLNAALSLVGVAALESLDLRRTGGYKEGAHLLWTAIEPQLLQWKRAERVWAMSVEIAATAGHKESIWPCLQKKKKKKKKKKEEEEEEEQADTGDDDEVGERKSSTRKLSALSSLSLPPLLTPGMLKLVKITPSTDRKIAPLGSPSSPSAIQKLKFNWSGGKSSKSGTADLVSVDSPGASPARQRRLSQDELAHQDRLTQRMLAKQSDGVNKYLQTNTSKGVPTGLRRRSSVGKAIMPEDDEGDEERCDSPGTSSPLPPKSPERVKKKVKKVKRRKVINPDGSTNKKQRKVLYEIVTTPRGAGTIRRKVISPSSPSSPTSPSSSLPYKSSLKAFNAERRGSRSSAAREGESEVYGTGIRAGVKLKLKAVPDIKSTAWPPAANNNRRGSAARRASVARRQQQQQQQQQQLQRQRAKAHGPKPYVVPTTELSGLPISKLLGGRNQFLFAKAKRERERQLLGLPPAPPTPPGGSGVFHMLELRLVKAGLGVVEVCVLSKLLLAGAGAHLVTLDLKHNPALTVGWGEGGVMVGVVRRRLKRLVRLGNELKGLRAIAEAVVAHPKLKELDIRCCALGWRGGGERDETALALAAERRAWEWEEKHSQDRKKRREKLGGGCIATAAEALTDCCGSAGPRPPAGPEQTCVGILSRCWQNAPALKIINGMPLRALSKGQVPGKRLDLSNQRLGNLELALLLPVLQKLSKTKPTSLRRLDLRSNAFLLAPHADADGSPTDRTIHMHPAPMPLNQRLFQAINGFCAPFTTANMEEETKNPTTSTVANAIEARANGKAKDAKAAESKEKKNGPDSDAATAAISAASTGPAVDLNAARPPPGFVLNGLPVRRQLHKQLSVAQQLAKLGRGGAGAVLACCTHVSVCRPSPLGEEDVRDEEKDKNKNKSIEPIHLCKHNQYSNLCPKCNKVAHVVLGQEVNDYAPVDNEEAYQEFKWLEKLRGRRGRRMGQWGGSLMVAMLRELAPRTKERVVELDLRDNFIMGRGCYDDGGACAMAGESLAAFHGQSDVHSILAATKEENAGAQKGASGAEHDETWRDVGEASRRKTGLRTLLALVAELGSRVSTKNSDSSGVGAKQYPNLESVRLAGNGVDRDIAAILLGEMDLLGPGMKSILLFDGDEDGTADPTRR
jgi:hypothetical protein